MTSHQTHNLLLKSLPSHVSDEILESSELVHLDIRESLIEPNQPIKFVDFPETGVMSLLQPMGDGSLVEIATIGNEGMIGIPVVMGVETIGERAFCQVEGSAHRISTDKFLTIVGKYPQLQKTLQLYAMTLFDQVARTTGCNRTHSTEQRCARWLLLTADRCHSDQFVLTQEFLAVMLGVSRTGVNYAAGLLSKAKLISYVRGRITIHDRTGLEAVCCDCYLAMTTFFKQVMMSEVK